MVYKTRKVLAAFSSPSCYNSRRPVVLAVLHGWPDVPIATPPLRAVAGHVWSARLATWRGVQSCRAPGCYSTPSSPLLHQGALHWLPQLSAYWTFVTCIGHCCHLRSFCLPLWASGRTAYIRLTALAFSNPLRPFQIMGILKYHMHLGSLKPIKIIQYNTEDATFYTIEFA